MSSVFHSCGQKYVMGSIRNNKRSNAINSWYRYPYQRDIKVCYGSEFSDIFVDGIIELHKQYGFDGFYFDGATTPSRCGNLEHGCGYTDKDGNLKPTIPQFEIREMFKRIYSYAKENNLSVQAHINGYNMALCGFYDNSLIGEDIQNSFLNGRVKRVPENLMKAKYTARDIGVPVYTTCYSGEKWPYESGAAIALLYGSMPKPVDIKKPLEYTSKLWKVFDEFPVEESKWLPYYNGNDSVFSDNENVKVSIYKAEDKILAVCTSIDQTFNGEVAISGNFNTIYDALTKNKLSDNGMCKLKFEGIQCKLLILNK